MSKLDKIKKDFLIKSKSRDFDCLATRKDWL